MPGLESVARSPEPVRGWLLFLCLLLTVWNPAALAFVAASRVGNSSTTSFVALVLLGIRLGVTGVGVAAGLALWNKRAGAVTLAKASLM